MEPGYTSVHELEDALSDGDECWELNQEWHARLEQCGAVSARGKRVTAVPRNWRKLTDWEQRDIQDFLTPYEFKRLYKFPSVRAFDRCAGRLEPYLGSRTKHASTLRTGGGVGARLKLAVAMRYFAGGSYLDIALCHGVSPNQVHRIVRQVTEALLLEYGFDPMVGLSVDKFSDPAFLERSDASFRAKNRGLLEHCVGAIDGMAVKISKPMLRDTPAPKHYYNRKGFFAVVLQAVCDGNRKFTWGSLKGVGSTHDSTCYAVSNLHEFICAGKLPSKYYIVGDEAYAAAAQMVVPYPGHHGFQDAGGYDAFNFYQSSTRMNIECAFGMLVQRFGVFWRKMEGTLPMVNKKVMACMLLHNIILHASGYDYTAFDMPSVTAIDLPNLAQYAAVPDGAIIGSSVEQADGSILHQVAEMTGPTIHSQGECALEEVTRPARESCPKRDAIRLHLLKERAKRPKSSKRRRELEDELNQSQ
eukprot:TRINITY_DN2370_c0_g1_i1.p1 TRINITY_DN2370_c0_g1~~TRINITY_DN2370_c0_g1_i1.p1  ORF type:complete len:473 (-),score=63.81 TRINITY_DN2370_c0_g1_i1:76-1494(-)